MRKKKNDENELRYFFSKLNYFTKFFIKKNFPKIVKIFNIIISKKEKVTFKGWGMITLTSSPPWIENKDFYNKNSTEFSEINNNLSKLMDNGTFFWSYFAADDHKVILDELKWRHYIVFMSSSYINNFTNSEEKILVECGACDGVTAYYAMNNLKKKNLNFKCYLYDSWSTIEKEKLTKSEKWLEGSYSCLDVDNTKNNLSTFNNNLIFNKGYIPQSFNTSSNPEIVSWLHVDLNSSIATMETLKFFYDKIENGGIILFDDYAYEGYEDTRIVVDDFLNNKNGQFFQLPTGQAIFFKK